MSNIPDESILCKCFHPQSSHVNGYGAECTRCGCNRYLPVDSAPEEPSTTWEVVHPPGAGGPSLSRFKVPGGSIYLIDNLTPIFVNEVDFAALMSDRPPTPGRSAIAFACVVNTFHEWNVAPQSVTGSIVCKWCGARKPGS